MPKKLSNKIKYLNLFMSVLVILIHSINNDTLIEQVFNQNGFIGQIAVPYFFIVSGFLFFNNVYSINDVIEKIKKRIRTILFPYFAWNVIYYFLNVLVKKDVYFSIIGLYDAAINHTYSSFMWFLYQLILIVFITPLLYYILKNKSFTVMGSILLCILVLIGFEFRFLNIDSVIYYFLGGIVSFYVSNKDKELINKKNIIYPFFLSIFFIIVKYLIHKIAFLYYFELLSIIMLRISLVVFVFYLFDFIFKYIRTPKILENTFVLYLSHYMVLRIIFYVTKFISLKFLSLEIGIIFEIIMFLLSPIICLFLNAKFCKILKEKNLNYFYILSGGR